MGCFSSKHAMRSRSWRDDLSLSLQSRTVGVPGLEDLFSSKTTTVGGGGDDLLALLCTANTVAMRLKEREEKLRLQSEAERDGLTSNVLGTNEPAETVGRGPEAPQPIKKAEEEEETEADKKDEVVFHEAINAWELMAGLEDFDETAVDDAKKRAHTDEEQQVNTAVGISSSHSKSRSSTSGSTMEQDHGREDELYDVEKQLSHPPLQDVPIDKLVISSSEIVDASSPPSQGCPHDDPVVKNVDVERLPGLDDVPKELLKLIAEIKPAETVPTADLHSPAPKGLDYSLSFRFNASFPLGDYDNDPHKELPPAITDTENRLKGVRRKAMARELKPLEVPAFEFKDIQLWMQGNQQALYDSDPYETPKFGKYLKSIAKAKAATDGAGESGALDPDLVASLQETIDGMTAEEERILKQFVEEFLGPVRGRDGNW